MDLVILFLLGHLLHRMVKAKGRSSTGYVWLLIGMWLTGGLIGIILGFILSLLCGLGGFSGVGFTLKDKLTLVLCAFGGLTGYALGASITFLIVFFLPKVSSEANSWEQEYEREWQVDDVPPVYRARRSERAETTIDPFNPPPHEDDWNTIE